MEQGRQLAADAQQEPTDAPRNEAKEEKAAVVKERRQRRKLTKQIRVKDQQAAEEEILNDTTPVVDAAVESVKEINTEVADTEGQEGDNDQKQRRNRRSPRHLRASGQRRRRGRDRRPNPFRLRKGGVASPEMAMGKVMPRYDLAKPAPKAPKVEETPVAEVSVALGGVACPEMAMGKVIIRRETPAVVAEAPMETPVVEAVAEIVAQPEVVETVVAPVVVEAPSEEPVAEPEVVVEVAVAEPVAAPIVEEAPIVVSKPVAKPAVTSGRASAPMAKAPGTNELKEITVLAAPFRSERYQSRGAGSQAASNQASATMTKPQF